MEVAGKLAGERKGFSKSGRAKRKGNREQIGPCMPDLLSIKGKESTEDLGIGYPDLIFKISLSRRYQNLASQP